MVLQEREAEIAAIAALVKAGGLLLFEGPAGVGKSALLREAERRGRTAGRAVLSAAGTVLERSYGFGVARQLLEPLLDCEGTGEFVTAPALAALGVGRVGQELDGSGFEVLRGLAALTLGAAERQPLLLLLDDVQWVDVASLRFLAFLARRLDGPDVAIAAAVRTGEPDEFEDLVEELRAAASTAGRVRPAALTEAATARLVRELDPDADDELCARCYAVTYGNPLLVTEIGRALARDGDPMAVAGEGIGPGVRRRLARAHPAGARVAEAAAVLGPEARLIRLAALVGCDPVTAGEAVTALERADILRAPEPYEFVHPLVQAAVLDGVDAGRLLALRGAAAALLESAGVAAEGVAAQLLFVPGTGDEELVRRMRAAAGDALARGAPASAATFLARALEEPPALESRATILRGVGVAERLAGLESAIDHLRAARELAADPIERATVSRELAIAQYDFSYYEAAAETVITALREAPHDLDPSVRDGLRVDLLAIALLVPSLAAEELLADLTIGFSPRSPAVAGALRVSQLALELTQDAVADRAGELEGLLAAMPPARDKLDLHTVIWLLLAVAERFGSLRSLLDAARADGRSWMRREFAINLAESRMRHRLGELDAAAVALEANLELGIANRTGLLFSKAALAGVCLDKGDLVRARRLLADAEVPATRNEAHLGPVHHVIGRLAAADGDDLAAARAFDTSLEIHRRFPNDLDVLWEEGGAERLACYWRLGRVTEARVDAERSLRVAQRTGLVGLEGIARRTIGLLAEDQRELEASVELLSQTPLRLELARSLVELGGAHRRSGRRTEARDPLRRALDLAHASGAQRLAARAREELVLAGARPRRDAHSGRDALTAAEQRVARLIAAGRTNREVATQLFVTIKTVEGHLGRIFRKLDIHSRGELAAALASDEVARNTGGDHEDQRRQHEPHAPGAAD